MKVLTKLVAGAATVVVAVAGTTLPAEALTISQNKAAQARLNKLGCNSGPVDGKVGQMTKAATIRFQAANKMTQNGSLAGTTYSRLLAASAKRCDVRAVPASGGGKRIVISQSQNYLWLIDAAGKVVRQGGMIDNPAYLRPGTYTTGSKCGRPARVKRNTDGGSLYLNNFVRFAPCGIGFHQIPTYKSSGAQIHADWLLGTNLKASHGCIRVQKAMSDTIWAFTTSTTKVVVVR
ncbi:ErfK/YbiS/YcfS/YnhG family protein [Kribbella flavida DSM 17836]|uniref:ErfK/YbiS/YcfS/YnhG family protein n=1 Tax=Kribbella flavida (strain DSM 17836 / JCM 10339 / NBRC 14399) TaxID=479435 RepID=D2PTE0_KRIFD|nr:L,D-transpeptidase family protein [Kribbella flavida]ADB29456.1 ErfK/YbiS/YcfS/YnhG family protein [Kribbella flavida DSM 17836]